MRIVRICVEHEARERSFEELKDMLIDREYTKGIIEAAINKARAIPREQALKCMLRQDTSRRPVFVVSFDPRLPSISKLTRKHWRSMVSQDKHLENVFPEAPLIAYKTQKKTSNKILLKVNLHQKD